MRFRGWLGMGRGWGEDRGLIDGREVGMYRCGSFLGRIRMEKMSEYLGALWKSSNHIANLDRMWHLKATCSKGSGPM
jgi:hypothetical protein